MPDFKDIPKCSKINFRAGLKLVFYCGAFAGARALHLATIVLLAAAGLGLGVGILYWLGVLLVAALLFYEHTLVRPGDLRRLDAAFFTMNGVISLAFFAFVLADVL